MAVLRTFLFLVMALLLTARSAFALSIPAESLQKLVKMDGSSFALEKRKAVLYFWASWCPSCRQKLGKGFPEIDRTKAAFLAVNTDADLSRAKHLLEREKYSVDIVRESGKDIATQLKVVSMPTWVVLSKEEGGSWKVVDQDTGENMGKLLQAVGKE
ncbi:MAG TPA: TlpA disulfide reductase family protein [Bdellovibrionota bacterium]|jgi:thiol-disulfide isomerase/thioredoxin